MERNVVSKLSHTQLSGVTHLGRKETRHGDAGRETYGDRHGRDTQRHMIGGRKIERHKSQPNDTRRIHGEANVLRLVECLGNFARQHGIHGAHDNQQDWEEEGNHV